MPSHKHILFSILAILLIVLIPLSVNHYKENISSWLQPDTLNTLPSFSKIPVVYHRVDHDIRIKDYFDYLQGVASMADSSLHLDEYVLAHVNPWIMDSLKATDYYERMKRNIFLYDQPVHIILHAGDSILLPDSLAAASIHAKLASTWIDVNIPEFKLRLMQGGDTILICPVRVGRNKEEYLEVAKHVVNLRTPVGEGEIIRIAHLPYIVNPETGKKYERTCRDDGRYTKMPVIPWLEPSINGIRYGTLIHPTSNPNTLGQPFSHGCIGTSETDAWTIYFNSPIGTRVTFRYDLRVINEQGDSVVLKDIYDFKKPKRK
ncbi:MAG: L,D-transpeptidase [Cyclobacteriaceae bacterium]|nr:L,D-transpeptidase [Cyclobacteriaceae bacterium]